MQVLYFTNMWPSSERPGFGAFVRAQAESVKSLGVEVDVLAMLGGHPAVRYGRGLIELRRRLRQKRADVIHAHYGYSVALASMQSETPVVGSYCGTDLYSPRQRLLCSWAGRRIAVPIVKNEEMKQFLGRRDTVVLPNGVDLSVFRPGDRAVARRELSLSEDETYVLFPYHPGRPEKRHALAVEALRTFQRSTGRSASLLVVHDRERDVYLRYLQAADAMLMTSAWEGSPNAVKEALACDIPVVSTPVGDVPDLVKGLRRSAVVEGTPQSLAAALGTALASSADGEGPSRMRDYSSDSSARLLLKCYRRALGQEGD
jgi:teichuronic acid biosynthesis glycosyltransferase TuaC